MDLLCSLPRLRPDPEAVTSQVTDSQTPLTDLISSLEHATLSANLLLRPSADSPQTLATAVDSLRNAHRQIESFLGRLPPLPPPPLSAAASVDEDEPMSEGEEEGVSRIIVDKVEEGMRGCSMEPRQRKRRRRSSPLLAEEDRREFSSLLDHRTDRLRSLDLIYQFHG
ncbi:hypothetical protein QJS04_geneDACA010894 [Acorus gramineus]|uniref:Uncharacterized protein n=1 Tax=Acorus gramineus TaxID=55184 RepID=A0AAV9BEL5_ACOGR|nr:hypothetical protein QJS04_geneDACA010894 [Acorus gramineus]